MMSDYAAQLGYTLTYKRIVARRAVRMARCDACKAEVRCEGSHLRSHRRRCPVAPGEPYTPAVCDA